MDPHLEIVVHPSIDHQGTFGTLFSTNYTHLFLSHILFRMNSMNIEAQFKNDKTMSVSTKKTVASINNLTEMICTF